MLYKPLSILSLDNNAAGILNKGNINRTVNLNDIAYNKRPIWIH